MSNKKGIIYAPYITIYRKDDIPPEDKCINKDCVEINEYLFDAVLCKVCGQFKSSTYLKACKEIVDG